MGFIFATILSISSAYAMSLQDAKSQGLVGERTDGYVGYVTTPAADDVKEIVKMVNNKRREKFQATATKNNISLEQVGTLFYKRAIEETQSSHFYQDASGNWIRK